MCLRNRYVVNITVLFLLFIFRSSYAGILPESGTVHDFETGKKVADARVVLQWTGTFGIGHGSTACYQTRFTKTGKSGRYLQFGGKLPGARLDLKDDNGFTASDYAVRYPDPEISTILGRTNGIS